MLAILDLYSEERPLWSVGDMCGALGYSRSTAYRYTKELADAGLLHQLEKSRYALGSRIVQWDRQLRLTDPLVRAARRLEAHLSTLLEAQTWLVCRLFKDHVVCIYQFGALPGAEVSYSRGTPRPLFTGATSKAILAFLPRQHHMRLFVENVQAIARSNLGADWDSFRRSLQKIRRHGYVHSVAEVDCGVYGIAAPVFDADGKVIASLSCVRPVATYREAVIPAQGERMVELATMLSRQMIAASNGLSGED